MAFKVTIPTNLKYLILHESPTEVKTIKKFLPSWYMGMATFWHFLITKHNELDIDINNWNINWKLDPKKKDNVKNIQLAIDQVRKNNWKVILAWDWDREGAVINYSVVSYFKLKENEYVVHKDPASLAEKKYMNWIKEAISLDMGLVESWITRQILDKYVWFEVSSHLWNISSDYKKYLKWIQELVKEKINKFEQNNKLIIEKNLNIKKIIDEYKKLVEIDIEDKNISLKKEISWKKWNNFWVLNNFEERKWISFGRVQTASLILLVNKEFEKFDKELDRKVNIQWLDNNGFLWEYERNNELETNIDKMKIIYDKINNDLNNNKIKSIKVIDINKNIKKVSPPVTLDTIFVQKGIDSQFWFSAKKTMDILQKLFQGWLTTYMRTDTNATWEEEDDYIKKMVNSTNSNYIYTKYTIKWAQEWHIWILPTEEYDINNLDKVTLKGGTKLNEDEYKVFSYVVKRTVAAFMEPAKVEYINYILEISWENYKEKFILKDNKLIEEWFLEVYDYQKEKYKEKVSYNIGDIINIKEFIWKEKDIKVSWGYTEPSFISELKSNWIWRPSTYVSILETLKEKKYIKFSNKKITVTPKWFWVYQVINQENNTFGRFKNINFTAKMEEWLDLIAQSKINRKPVLDWVKKEIDEFKSKNPVKEKKETNKESLWKCPSCKKWEILENQKAWGCSNWKGWCKFTIWKEISKHKITLEEVEYMIKNKESKIISDFTSKSWNKFEAKLIFDKKKWFIFNF